LTLLVQEKVVLANQKNAAPVNPTGTAFKLKFFINYSKVSTVNNFVLRIIFYVVNTSLLTLCNTANLIIAFSSLTFNEIKEG